MATLSFDDEVPVLCAETTGTGGTGTITLSGTALDNHRTLAQAAAVGHVSSGDVLAFIIRDTATPPTFEYNTGTWTSGSNTLTRNTPDQSSTGVSKINWPGTGSRDVLIVANLSTTTITPAKIGAAALTSANTFSADQTIDKTGSTAALNIRSDQSTGAPARLRLGGHNSAAANIDYLIFQSVIVDNTAASEDGRGDLLLYAAGSQITTHRFNNDGSLTNVVSSTTYDAFPGGGVTKLLFGGAIPAGWTRVNETNPSIIRLAVSGDTVGATGGSADIFTSWTTNGHTLTESEIPAHVHQYRTGAGGGSDAPTLNTGAPIAAGGTTVASAGGGGSHLHNMTTPRYRIAAWATKD